MAAASLRFQSGCEENLDKVLNDQGGTDYLFEEKLQENLTQQCQALYLFIFRALDV